MSWKHLGGCKPKSAAERFAIYAMPVPEAGCWLWLGPESHNGYGRFKIAGRSVVASRYAWEVTNGPVPEGLYVCHKCDTPSCVNPSHLFVGTQQDNENDKVTKGRHSRGERHARSLGPSRGTANGNSHLTADAVAAIRADTRPQRVIASDYGVSQGNIHCIKTWKTWKTND